MNITYLDHKIEWMSNILFIGLAVIGISIISLCLATNWLRLDNNPEFSPLQIGGGLIGFSFIIASFGLGFKLRQIQLGLRLGHFQVTAIWFINTVVSFIAISTIFGVPLNNSLSYLLYISLYVIIPGIIVYTLFIDKPRTILTTLLHGWVFGQLLEICIYFLLIILGLSRFFVGYPLVIAGIVVWQRKKIFSHLNHPLPGPDKTQLAALWIVSLILIFLGALAQFGPQIDPHFTWVAAFASAVMSGDWPFDEPFLLNIPLNYHYLFNIHIAAANQISVVPLELLSSRLSIVIHLFLFIALVFNFTYEKVKSGWIGLLAMTQLFAVYGQSAIMWQYFHFATAQVTMRLPSALVSFEILIVLIYEMTELLETPKLDKKQFAFVAIIIVISSGIRGHFLPVLGSALVVLSFSRLADI
jgi:hypothetical protein